MSKTALDFASYQHRQQKRRTGESYIHHPLAVRQTLEELGLTGAILDCALLHDVCEDTNIALEDVHTLFGEVIGDMVAYLTKEPKRNFERTLTGHLKRHRNYLSHFEQGLKTYPEIMLVKMSDQFDNLASLEVFDLTKQARIVDEIWYDFVPLYERNMEHLSKNLEQAARILLARLKQVLCFARMRMGVLGGHQKSRWFHFWNSDGVLAL